MPKRSCQHTVPCEHGLQAYREDRCRCIICRQTVALRYAPPTTLIDGTGTARRIQALVFIGYSLQEIQERLGFDVAHIAHAHHPRVTVGPARAVLHLYNELWRKPQNVPYRRKYARARGWVGPLSWDDDTIEDPAVRPAGIRPSQTNGVFPFDDLEEMIRRRISMDEITAITGTTPDAVYQRLYRAGRKDLVELIPHSRKHYAKARIANDRIPA